MGDPFWQGNFGPMLSGIQAIPFADIEALEKQLATRQFAAFFMEPIQSEGGIRVPTREYMQAAQASCRKHGTLFVLDVVQTGMYRTGPFLAAHHFDVEPDMVVLAKALNRGLIPVGAVLMSDAIYKSVFGSLRNAIIHASTFSENSISMRVGLATLLCPFGVLLLLNRSQFGDIQLSGSRPALSALFDPLPPEQEIKGLNLVGLPSPKHPSALFTAAATVNNARVLVIERRPRSTSRRARIWHPPPFVANRHWRQLA